MRRKTRKDRDKGVWTHLRLFGNRLQRDRERGIQRSLYSSILKRERFRGFINSAGLHAVIHETEAVSSFLPRLSNR